VTQSVMSSPIERDVAAATEQAVLRVRPWVARAVRLGFVTKGVVYVIMGALATKAAMRIGRAEDVPDPRGALGTILRRPFGQVMLTVAAAGLAAYAVWRLSQAIFDLEHDGTTRRHWLTRVARAGSGLAYGSLALAALELLTDWSLGAGSGRPRDWTAKLMARPMGTWAVAAIGAGVVAVGAYHLYRAVRGKFSRSLRLRALSPRVRWCVTAFGRLGFAARGAVFALVGAFLIIAAERHSPGEAKGLAEALRALEAIDYGPWAVGAVGVGLIAYGVFQFVEAVYRRIDVG
jgi:hypothetical protein